MIQRTKEQIQGKLSLEKKIYECAICKKLARKGLKGEKRFIGTRKAVRKHLVEVHRLRGRKNLGGLSKKEFGQSNITKNCIEVK